MYQLEERILFDGAAAVDLAVAQQEQQAQDTQAQAQADAAAQAAATAATGDQTQTQNPHEATPAIPADTESSVPTSDTASADHSSASLSAPMDASNPGQPADTHHVNVLVVSDSLENADELFKSANSDTIVVRYNEKTTTGAELLQEITDSLNGEKADSIGFVTDKAHDGAVSIFSDSDTSTQSLSTETQKNFWNGVEGLLSENGKVNIFASDLASTENGRHLVDSLSQITNHQVAASTDVTGDADAKGNWELEYVAKGTGSVDLIEEYFNRESIQTFDHRIENPTEIAFIDASVKDADTIVSQLDKDIEVVYLTKDNAFNDISSYLNGRTDVDSIHIISDADHTTGGFFLGKEIVDADFIASHSDALADWGKSMSTDGDIHIYGCNVAKDQVGKDLISQIASATGTDVAASTDITGLAGNWNLEYAIGTIETHDFIINNYYHNLNTLTVRRLDDYMVTNPYGVDDGNLTLREAILIAVNGDNIVFADYTILHSKTSTTPDPFADWPLPGHIFVGPDIYHTDAGAVNHAGGYAFGATTIAVTGFDGKISVGSYITFAGDQNSYKVKSVNVGAITTSITLSTGLLNATADQTVITGIVNGLVDTITIKANVTIDGTIVTPTWTDAAAVVHPEAKSPVILDARSSFRGIYIDSHMNADQTGISLSNMVVTNGVSLSMDLASPAGGNGGGIYISGISAVTMTITVSNSEATYGGGIYNAGVLTMNGKVFGNTADDGSGVGNGGGIYNVGLLTSSAGNIYNNSAVEHGGGIYNDGTMDLAGTGPQSTVNVGCYRDGIFLKSGPNSAGGNGGGIYSNNGNLSMEYVNIRNNNASGNGGGLYIFSNYEQSEVIHFTFVDLINNYAGIDGGGLFFTNGNSVSVNNVFELEWSVISSNIAEGNGGGLCFFNNAGNILIATTITENTTYNTQGWIDGNIASNGAGIYIENCENITIDFIEMSGNGNTSTTNGDPVTVNGGAIYVKDSGTVTLTDMEINSNWASVNGGGIYYTNSGFGALNINTSNISNNWSLGDGGGIYQANGMLSVENSTLSKNIAFGLGGAIYMNYGTLGIDFSTLAYNQGFGFGSTIYIAGNALGQSALTVTNSIIYNLNSDIFGSQIYIPLAANIDVSGFSTTSNIYSHYFQDRTSNPAGHSLNLTISSDPLIARLYGTDQSASDLIQANLYLDTNLLYHANYRTMALAIISSNSWAYNATTAGLYSHDQRGNSRMSGYDWTWDSVSDTWVSSAKTKTAIGAFDPIFHVEVVSKGDDSQLWYTADQNARYYDTAMSSGNGLTLREAIYWIDTRVNALAADYNTRYVGFDKVAFGSAGDGIVYDNSIQLGYGQIEIGGRWGNYTSYLTNRDVAVGYMIRNPDNTGDIIHHDNTLRAKDDPSRITVLAGGTGNAVNRLFMNSYYSVLALNNLTLSGGAPGIKVGQYGISTDGGGIYNEATMTLINMVVQNSTAAGGNLSSNYGGRGGGIYNDGTAYIYDSSILNNTATSIRTDPSDKSPNAGQGGGIWNGNGGTMTIDRSRISGNTANGASDLGNAMLGGGIYNSATLTIERSEISGNKASGATIDKNGVKGAGIYNNSSFNMANCTVAENILDTTGVKIDYAKLGTDEKPLYHWGSYASGIYNAGNMISYYSTIINNKSLVNDVSFWNATTNRTVNLESLAGFYNADGARLALSNSMLVENIAILTVTGEVWQRSDIYVRTAGDINTSGENGKNNIIGGYNTPRTEQYYIYYAPSTTKDPTPNTPVYYELTYTGAAPTWNPVFEFVATEDGAPVNTGFEWNGAGLHNTIGFFNMMAASGAPSYLTLNPTTAEFLNLHPLPAQYADVANPFIYTQKLLPDGSTVPGVFIRVTGFDDTGAIYTEINTNDNGGNIANLTAGLYGIDKVTPVDFNFANNAYSDDLFSTTTPSPTTVIMEAGHTPVDPGFIPNVSNPRYGIVDNLNLDFNLSYNGALTKTYRVLSGSIAANYGIVLSNPGVFNDATFYTDQRGADRGFPGDLTNSGSFDYIAHLTVRSAYDDSNPRTGFDYTIYKPLWDSTELTLREAVNLADDGTDITFKNTWQINGTTYIDPITGAETKVANELDAGGNLIINLVGGELQVSRSVTIDGMFQWNLVDANGIITSHRFGGISQLTAGTTDSRIFHVKNAVAGVLSTVGISNFDMDGNGAIVTGNGGGIFSYSNLSLDNIAVMNCTAIAGLSGSDGMGGGIYSEAGYLILNNSLVFGNTGTMGGGIFAAGGKPSPAGFVLDITGTGITGNTAKNADSTDGRGGGVYVQSGAAHFQYSTIGSNKAVSDGGGIFVATTTSATVTDLFLLNSTVANNTAGRNGGGISFYSNSNLNLNFATVANNQSGWTVAGAASNNPYAFGGGIYMNSGAINVTNSILAQNYRGSSIGTILVPAFHDDLYLNNSGTNTIDHSVYGVVDGLKNNNGSARYVLNVTNSTHVTDWNAFAGKLDTQLLNNGGENETVYVIDNAFFQITAVNNIRVDQTMLDLWNSRATVGSFEKIARTFYYIDGEIGKGAYDSVTVSNGGSRWVSDSGIILTELDGVLNASDATFVVEPGLSKPSIYVLDYSAFSINMGYIVSTAPVAHTTSGTAILRYDWDMKAGWDVKYTTNHGSYLDLGGAANFTVAAGTTAAFDIELGGLISVRDRATLIFQSTNLANTRLFVNHVPGVSNTSVYYGKEPVSGSPLSTGTSQTVFTSGMNPLTGVVATVEYDNLYLYGKDKAGAIPAPLYTKNAAGTLHVNGTLVVGDSSDNVKLDITTADANPGDLLILGTAVHNYGQIAVGNDMTVTGTVLVKTTIDSGGTITVARNLAFTDVVVNTQKTITANGDMAMTRSTITGLNSLSVSGDLAMTGSVINSTPISVTGNLIMNGSAINGATTVTVGNMTHASNLEMTSSTITGNATTTAVSATGDILMTNSTITGAKSITASGDLTVADSTLDGGAGTTNATAGGDVYLVGTTSLTNLTIKAGSGRNIVFGNDVGTATTVTLDSAVLGAASNGVEFKNNSSLIANGLNSQIISKGLTMTGWLAGTITVNGGGALKINIGAQTLTLTDTVTTSTPTALNLGLDRLIVNANSRLEIVTTNTVTSSATNVAPSVDGTLALSGIISFGSTNIISLSSTATLELGGTITITKDAVGVGATISMQNSLNIVGNVKINTGVTGNISITSTGGSIIIGSDVTAGSRFTGNGKNLTISAFLDASVGNITAVKDISVTSTNGNIHLLSSITATGNILFNGDVKVHLSYTSAARTPASVTVIAVTAGIAGTITTTGAGYSTFGLDCSELQFSAGSAAANALKTVNLNRSLSILKGAYTSTGITLTGDTANLMIKGTQAITVSGNIILNGGKIDNPVTLSVSGDISMLNGALNNLATGTIKMTGGIGSDVILTGNASFVNSGTFSNASSKISLVNGSLTNAKTLNADSITFTGTGSLTNTSAINIGGTISLAGGNLINYKTLVVSGTGDINLADGALTNTGTITVAGDVALTGSASFNNNAGTVAANSVSLATGTLINKGSLTANSLDIGGGNLNNSGTLKERSAGLSHIGLVGGTFTNTGTVTSFDTLTLDGANLTSGTKAFNVTTLNLLGADTRNLTISPLGMTVATLNMGAGNAKMIGGKLTVTGNFNFGSALAAPNQYFQLGNTVTSIATLEVRGNVINDDITHFFVTLGNNKIWVNPGTLGTSIHYFLSDSPVHLVSEIDIGVTVGTSKMVGISTFTPLTVNGKYNGSHVGNTTALNSVSRAWNITRTTGEFSPLTVKFYWDASEKGANLNVTNAKLWTIAGSSWSLTNPGAGAAGFVGNTYETNILRYSGSYSVSAFAPSLAMNENSSLGAQLDALKEKFFDAIFGAKEQLAEQQQVAEAQERSAMEDMLSQMANRGNIMERNKLFKTEIDIGLEALLAV